MQSLPLLVAVGTAATMHPALMACTILETQRISLALDSHGLALKRTDSSSAPTPNHQTGRPSSIALHLRADDPRELAQPVAQRCSRCESARTWAMRDV